MENSERPAAGKDADQFYDTDVTCLNCDWVGTGRQAKVREIFAEVAEFECPECEQYFGAACHPLA